MDYITTLQASKLWGISPTRITILAKEGRIPGAKKMGGGWMIPQNAEKPLDARTKMVKTQKDNVFFRFPLFAGKEEGAFSPPLTEEELRLKKSSELFFACRFEEAEKVLGNLSLTAGNIYIRIAAVHAECMICLALTRHKEFLQGYGKLVEILATDFPYKKEMEFFLQELNATLGIGNYFSEDFEIDPGYSYHESFLPNLATLPSLALYYSGDRRFSRSELNSCELDAIFVDSMNSPIDSQSIHMYLGFAYSTVGDIEKATEHYLNAFRITKKYNFWWLPAIEYYYYGTTMANALQLMDVDFSVQLNRISNILHSRYIDAQQLTEHIGIYQIISKNKYIYVILAAKDYSNKEVARLLHISVNTVAKNYSDIYDTLSISNKKELVDFYFRSLNQPLPL